MNVFQAWGHLKLLLYYASAEREDTFNQPSSNACQTIYDSLGTFENMRQSIIRGVKLCIDSGRGQFERLLQIVTL
jgi:hypothetical protein